MPLMGPPGWLFCQLWDHSGVASGFRVARPLYWPNELPGPAEVFATEEQPRLKAAPQEAFDIPTWTHPKVAPDRHVQIGKALYSVPGELVGKRLDARVDAHTVKLYWRGELIKVHPVVAPGRRHTDPADLPAEVSAYAMRDLNTLQHKASAHGRTSRCVCRGGA